MTLSVPNEAIHRRLPAHGPIDLRLTLAPLRHGPFDPTIRFEHGAAWLALRLRAGPAVLLLVERGEEVAAHAWGLGAEAAIELAPGLAGLLDEPDELVARHALVRDLQRRFVGLRFPRTAQLVPALVPAVIEQKVTSTEAHAGYSRLLRRLGEPAPSIGEVPIGEGPIGDAAQAGPARDDAPAPRSALAGPRLLLPPDPRAVAALPYYEFHPLGIERRRAEVLRRIGKLAARIESFMELSPAEARERLQEIAGVGPWTAAEATRTAFGDPDAVSVGDAHIPSMVTWALAGEARGDDARMLELLEPYAGQRGRVVRLLEAAGIQAPRRGPRFAPREIAAI